MGISGSQDRYINVYKMPIYGRLDPEDEATDYRDAALIRTYIRAEKEVAASGRTPPSIARAVLTSIWETPRIRFHREARKSFTKEADFRNKLLWAPWSIEAANRWNETKSVTDLVLEHVTPIDWMWRTLTKLDDDFDDPTSGFHPDPEWGHPDPTPGLGHPSRHEWENHAASYLNNFWAVATLTKEQASAIDKYKGFRKTGFERNPFRRYFEAEQLMDQDRVDDETVPSFSTAEFVLPGHASNATQLP